MIDVPALVLEVHHQSLVMDPYKSFLMTQLLKKFGSMSQAEFLSLEVDEVS